MFSYPDVLRRFPLLFFHVVGELGVKLNGTDSFYVQTFNFRSKADEQPVQSTARHQTKN